MTFAAPEPESPRPLRQIAILGVGLLGGSVALASRHRQLCGHCIGLGRRAARLAAAVAAGVIDHGEVLDDPPDIIRLREALRDVDLAVVATPVDRIAHDVRTLAECLPPGTVITDAGSTKATITAECQKLPRDCQFVPAHPLAGSDRSGFEHASADLFVDRVVVLTPAAHTCGTAVDRVYRFWRELGAEIKITDPTEHDAILARTSHLPHVVAIALVRQLRNQDNAFVATGFADTTRIAMGDPGVWEAIFVANSTAVADEIQHFRRQLEQWEQQLRSGDGSWLKDELSHAKTIRETLAARLRRDSPPAEDGDNRNANALGS